MYLKELKAGGLSLYIDNDYTPAEPTMMDITVTNFPEAKVAEHYALHAWGGEAAAANYVATLNGTTLTASIPNDCTGFLVASYNGAFDWDSLVYKSGDFVIQSGVTTYALPDLDAKITLSITGVPSQYQSNDLYVYYWDSATASTFIKGSVSGSSLSAEVPADIGGFLVVVMQTGKTPGWSGTDGFVGQSNDYPYSAGTTSYAWVALK